MIHALATEVETPSGTLLARREGPVTVTVEPSDVQVVLAGLAQLALEGRRVTGVLCSRSAAGEVSACTVGFLAAVLG